MDRKIKLERILLDADILVSHIVAINSNHLECFITMIK